MFKIQLNLVYLFVDVSMIVPKGSPDFHLTRGAKSQVQM